jgi:hypothetical protein
MLTYSASPNAKWEFQSEWQARAQTGKFYRFERIIIADRKCGHLGGGISKPMDRAFETPVPANWIKDLRDRVLETYGGPVSLEDPAHERKGSKPVVTYLSRQTAAHRRLTEETHSELLRALEELEEEGVAEVHVEEFTDADPKDEQVAKLSRTTVSDLVTFDSHFTDGASLDPRRTAWQRIDKPPLDDT